eukprot:424921-Rhodomonas_salina.2
MIASRIAPPRTGGVWREWHAPCLEELDFCTLCLLQAEPSVARQSPSLFPGVPPLGNTGLSAYRLKTADRANLSSSLA